VRGKKNTSEDRAGSIFWGNVKKKNKDQGMGEKQVKKDSQ